MKRTIACHIHDYFEAACVRNYTLEIELESAVKITGKAINIRYNKAKIECLEVAEEHTLTLIPLIDIRDVKVLDCDAQFLKIPIN